MSCEEDAKITWWDDISVYDECADKVATLMRTWFVEDDEGNVSDCIQEITILPG